jgi:hypothetical protein
MLRSLLALPLLLLAPLAQAQQLPPEQAAIKAHIQFLASDALRGRESGTRDFDVAANYMAAQFLAAGLKPGGADGSWYQPVKLATYKPSGEGTMKLVRGNSVVPLAFGVDFVNLPVAAWPSYAVSGQMVFAGYGLVYPEGKRDDYKGLDVKGKIVVMLPGLPAGLPSDLVAHYGDDDQKARVAAARGAKAVVILESEDRKEDYAFSSFATVYDYERQGWAGPDGVVKMVSPQAPAIAYVSQAGAAKLFQGAKIKWADVLAAEKAGKKLPTGPLAYTLDAAMQTRARTVESKNVVGVLEGSDPVLKNQYIVLSAHLDHVGIGEAVDGDVIYNGATDNALGNAMILEIARRFQAEGKRPRRSLIFISLTAEEKGLIGSDYFAHHPTVPKGSIVADLNIDMPIMTYALKDLVILGGERSSLGPALTAAAAAEGLATVPDPAPEEMFFVRSDHYSFVQAGIPAVSIDTGPGGDGDAAQKKFLAENYHKPSDQLTLPFNWDSALKYLRVTYAATRTLADADERPRWNKGDFFGAQFDGYGAK